VHAAMWRLFANTGMRRGEGAHLLKRWVGREGIKIVSTGEERTKSGDWREVPKSEGAAEALDRLKHAVDGQYVLPRFALPALSRAFVRDARRAKLAGSLHHLRHTYISHLMRDTDTRIRTIQLYAGHASIVTTEGYAYLRDNLGGTSAAALAL
jgi:integrase